MDTLVARVAGAVAAMSERVALVDGGRRITYASFWAHAGAFSRALRARGMRDGERVAIVLPNRIEAAVAVYGCWLAGGIAVPLHAQAHARDLGPWLRHCGARHVVHEAGDAGPAEAMATLESAPVAWPVRSGEAIVPCEPGAGKAATPPPCVSPDADALILYTSGTTGAPKGVTLTHANLLANATAVVAYLDLDGSDSVLGVLPFYYAYGASVLHTHLLAGACVVLAPNMLFPHLLMEMVSRERITGISGVPSTFSLLLDRNVPGDHDLSSLRYLTQAGGAMSKALTLRLRDALPRPRLFVMYGQTEATSRLSWLPPEQLASKLGSVGIPVAGVSLRVVRDGGVDAGAGEEGEVWARGPNVMRGYWNAPIETARVLRDGWLRTGDTGWLDEDGYLFLAGRRTDMIKTGAHRVHPAAIEEVICEIDGVAEVAVVGIDDATLGQVVKAFVVRRGEQRDPSQFALAIKAHCRDQMAPYKIPREIAFVDALPRTASGKVRRVALGHPCPPTPSLPACP
jgi:acyl-CoA synthetase (AMP-forming)/AMP-acid ligase II